jgi:hypothetical protein
LGETENTIYLEVAAYENVTQYAHLVVAAYNNSAPAPEVPFASTLLSLSDHIPSLLPETSGVDESVSSPIQLFAFEIATGWNGSSDHIKWRILDARTCREESSSDTQGAYQCAILWESHVAAAQSQLASLALVEIIFRARPYYLPSSNSSNLSIAAGLPAVLEMPHPSGQQFFVQAVGELLVMNVQGHVEEPELSRKCAGYTSD